MGPRTAGQHFEIEAAGKGMSVHMYANARDGIRLWRPLKSN